MKLALTFTIIAAVVPLQDAAGKHIFLLQVIRWFKVIMLICAFIFALYWLWTSF
jgi:hypothetical protein